MNIMITGAQLGNKGAESMLYVTVDAMRRWFPECKIAFCTSMDYNCDNYRFDTLKVTPETLDIALGGVQSIEAYLKCGLKDIWSTLKGKNKIRGHANDLRRMIQSVDMIVDISGFNLGSLRPRTVNVNFLKRIELAQKYKIPMVLMPQSFGPLEFEEDRYLSNAHIKELLSYPRLIFARERTGYQLLTETLGLKNVLLSPDLVLQSREINLENVFVKPPQLSVPKVFDSMLVGIVPNSQCFIHGEDEHILAVYRAIISKLLNDGYRVVVFRHSDEDISCCRRIRDMFHNDERITVEKKALSCLEYNEYVKSFNWLIGSRYHGIVHAYKNGIPCVVLGWAVKYRELTECMGQDQYMFDIIDRNLKTEMVLNAVDNMERDYQKNRRIILERLRQIQENNCFEKIRYDQKTQTEV